MPDCRLPSKRRVGEALPDPVEVELWKLFMFNVVMMMSEKKWYAIYTKPRFEKRVAELLTRQQIEHICPVLRFAKSSTDRQKKLLEPVFAGYIFIYIPENAQQIIKQTDGVLNFVYWLGSPVSFSGEEIDAMRFLMDETGSLLFEKISITSTARLSVNHGPFLDWTGYAAELRNKTVKIYLPGLAVKISAEVSMSRKEKVRFINATGLPLISAEAASLQTNTGS